jgi:hypothetical protein
MSQPQEIVKLLSKESIRSTNGWTPDQPVALNKIFHGDAE